jgi:hypothetical protein
MVSTAGSGAGAGSTIVALTFFFCFGGFSACCVVTPACRASTGANAC